LAIRLSLATIPVFQFVSPEHRERLSAIAKVIDKSKGDVVLMRGETVPGIYIVADGGVGVYPPGVNQPLVSLGVGESLGEMSFLERSKASVTVRAEVSPTRLVVLPQGDVATLAEQVPDLGRALYRGMAVALSRKLRTTTDKIALELDIGRKLLKDLSDADAAAVPLDQLPEEVVRQNHAVLDGLDQSLLVVGELKQRGDKPPQQVLVDLEACLAEARGTCAQFYPRLARHVAAVNHFIKRMEEFIVKAARE
jgi:CRP-like cAMP-binding protein